MKPAQSGVRGVYWRAHPFGSQAGPRGRGDWWIRWTCTRGHLHREKVGPKRVARDEYQRRKVRTRTEGYCLRHTSLGHRVLLREVLNLVTVDYERNQRATAPRVTELSKHLLAGFGAETLAADITPTTLERYTHTRLSEKAAAATINRELAVL